jgi:hypothetical protein
VQQDTLQSSHFSCFLTFLSGATSVKATSSFRQLYNWQLDSRHSSVYIHSYSKRLVHFFNFLFMSRLDRLRREDDGKNRASKKAQDVEQSLLSRATAPTSLTGTGESLKSIKDKDGKDAPSTLQTIGDHSAGYLLKRSPKNGEWNKYWFVLNAKTNRLSFTEKPEDRNFLGAITLDVCCSTLLRIPLLSAIELLMIQLHQNI